MICNLKQYVQYLLLNTDGSQWSIVLYEYMHTALKPAKNAKVLNERFFLLMQSILKLK